MPTKYTAAELRNVIAGLELQRDKARSAYDYAISALQGYEREVREAKKALTLQLERDAKNAVARDRRTAKKLAAKLGVDIERDDMGSGPAWWVTGPDAVYGGGYEPALAAEQGVRADPCAGNHFCTCWEEVLECVEAYRDDLAQRVVVALAEAR